MTVRRRIWQLHSLNRLMLGGAFLVGMSLLARSPFLFFIHSHHLSEYKTDPSFYFYFLHSAVICSGYSCISRIHEASNFIFRQSTNLKWELGFPHFGSNSIFVVYVLISLFLSWHLGWQATFKITLDVPSNLASLSNMPAIEEKVDGHLKTVSYQESPIMSTYLVAIVVGLFDYVEDHTSDGKDHAQAPMSLIWR